MKTILITGATSFIGTSIIKQLINMDYIIYAVVRPGTDKINMLPKSKNIKIIELNMSDYSLIYELIDENCDVFLSLAWNGTRGADRNNYELQNNNYECSVQSLKSAIKLNCKKVVIAGSQAEYGLHNSIVSESMPCNPVTEYGKFKLAYFKEADRLCKAQNISLKELRIFSLYGDGDYEGTMIIDIIKKMLKNMPCDLTKCEQIWDFLYVDDASSAIIDLIEKPCDDGIYNIGSGEHKKLKDYIEIIYKLTNSESILNFGAIPYPSNGIVNVMPDVTKLKSQTNFSPQISFEEGINKIIRKMKRESI